MIIEKIELENWMSYPKWWLNNERNQNEKIIPTIEFAQDLTLITGRNGSGKSAILEAICYALFATYPRAKKNEDAIHSGEGSAKVRLFFSLPTGKKDAKYCIERLLSKKAGQTNATLKQILDDQSEKLLEEGQSKVTSYIVDRLLQGVNYEAFVSAVFLRQAEAGKFMKLSHGEQQKQILHLGRLEIYKKIHGLAQRCRRETKNKLDGYEADFDKVKYATKQLLSSKRKAASELQDKTTKLRKTEHAQFDMVKKIQRCDELQAEITEGTTKLKTWQSIIKDADKIRHADKWTAEWKRLKMPLEEGRKLHADLGALFGEVRKADSELKSAEAALNKIQTDYEKEESDLKRKSLMLSELTKRIPQLMKQKQQANQKLDESRRVRKLDDRIAERKEHQKKRATELSELPALGKKHQFHSLLKDARTAIEHALAVLQQSEDERKVANNKKKEAKQIKEVLSKLSKSVDKNRSDLSHIEEKRDKIKTALEESTNQLNQLEDILENRNKAIRAGKCPTCGAEIKEERNIHIHDEIKEIESKCVLLGKHIKGKETELTSIESQVLEMKDLSESDNERANKARNNIRIAEEAAKSAEERSHKLREKATGHWKEKFQSWKKSPSWINTLSTETLAKIEKELKPLMDIENEYQELKTVEVEFNSEAKEITREQKERANIELKSPITDVRLRSLETAFNRASAEYEAANKQSGEMEDVVEARRKKVKELREALQNQGKCVNELDKNLSTLTTKRDNNETRFEQIKVTLNNEESELVSEFADLARGLMPSLEAEETYAQLGRLSRSYLRLQEQLDELIKAESDSQELRMKISEHKKKLAQFNKEVGELTLQEAEGLLAQTKNQIDKKQNEFGVAKEEIGATERDHKQRETLQPQIKQLQNQFWAFKTIERAIAPGTMNKPAGDLLASITTRLMEGVAATATTILEELAWPIEVQYNKVAGFLLEDKTMATSRQYTEFSGGECFAVAISVALAIGTVTHRASNIRCLFIDEGFGTLDTKNRKKIVDDAIRNLIQSGTRDQVVIITHLEDIQNFPRNIVLSKEDDHSVLAQNEEAIA